MHCPYCGYTDTKVIDSRLIAEGLQTRRRRECPECGERFTTFETAELLMPKIIKQRNNMREPFNEQKLREGLFRALEKRPVGEEEVEKLIEDIKKDIRATGEREVKSRLIGEIIMKRLRLKIQNFTIKLCTPYLSRRLAAGAKFQNFLTNFLKDLIN